MDLKLAGEEGVEPSHGHINSVVPYRLGYSPTTISQKWYSGRDLNSHAPSEAQVSKTCVAPFTPPELVKTEIAAISSPPSQGGAFLPKLGLTWSRCPNSNRDLGFRRPLLYPVELQRVYFGNYFCQKCSFLAIIVSIWLRI